MLKLENFPKRCPLALESQYLDIEVRQLLYAKKYRILFSINQIDKENSGIVQIHRVRHSYQQNIETLGELLNNEEE
ncbi:MAG: hypothetical protein AAF383_05385 [Cyanobacteria bacterium P01_A01_bin.83]